MTNPSPINIAIIGFSGQIGRRHTSHVLENSSTNLVALVDPSPVATSLAATHHAPYFPDVSTMLAFTIPDAAIVCTPNHTHVPVATELASAGVHLLVEKPLSTSVAEGEELVKFANKKGVMILVGHHRRFNSYVVATKASLDSGLLGSITAISGLWTTYKPPEYFNDSPALAWRSKKSQGGGVVLINFVHEIDLMQYFFGPVIRVHAEKTISRRKTSNETDSAEEGAALTLRFASGVVGTFILSDNVVSPYNFEASTGENPIIPQARTASGDEVDVYRIFGTQGTLSVPDMVLWRYGGKKSWESVFEREKVRMDHDGKVPFARQLENFVRVVRGEEEPRCDGVEGLRAMLVCDVVRKALDGEGVGGSVDVPELQGL